MSERVPAQNKTSATPSQATPASSPLLRRPLTDEQSQSVGSSSNISQELGGIQPKTIRRSLNWQNISVEAPSRGNGMSLPGGIQRQQEEQQETPEIQAQLAADSAQKSALDSSNLTISTFDPAQKPLIARAPFNGRNIPVEAPQRSSASSAYPGEIQRLETSGVKEQEKSTESLQMQPEEAIQAKSSEGEKPEKEEPNNSSIQTKLTVGAPGDKYEQEADSMAAKVMTMPDSAIQQPIQRQTGEKTEAVQRQPLVNSITPLVQRQTAEDSQQVQLKPNGSSSQASGSVESRLADSKGGGSPLPDDVRSFMEPRFGADFSGVRVHTDSNAVQMNKELGAQAFAHGSDIYFGAGKSPGNNELTAHELTHVVQQKGISHIQREAAPSNHEKMLDEAINIVQHALNALAAQSLGENNTNVTTISEAKNQEQGLRTVLDHLRSLKGSGKVDEILQLTQPILAAARGDLVGVNHMQGEHLSQQEPSQGSTPTIQCFAQALAAPALMGTGIAIGPVGWAIIGIGAVAAVGYASYKANEASRSRPVPRAVPRAVPRTQTRRKRKGPYPIKWPYLSGKGLSLVAPNPANSIFIGRRLVRTTPPTRNQALIDQFKATTTVQKGQAVHHVTPLFLGGPDALGNLAAVWISYHKNGHTALYSQPHLAQYGISPYLLNHPPGTPYVVSAIV